MCTAATYKTRDFYFGRTLDYEFSYGDQITIAPRNYPFHFRHAGVIDTHFAIIGMAHVAENYPLYYDAINEKGLGMAGLNFVGNAAYADVKPGLDNIAQFEFIPWILSQCASVAEVRTLLARMNLVNTPFSKQFHWHSSTGSSPTRRNPSPWNPCPTGFISTTIRWVSSPTIHHFHSRCSS